MTSQRLQQVEEAFFSVINAPPDCRAEALEQVCDGDEALRAEVQSLLVCEHPPGPFLSTPALGRPIALTERPRDDDLVGFQVGTYRIEQRLAAGGMGAVYRAVRADGQFEQYVAIKIVKRGMDSEEIVRRFRQERRTLAALNHPNIARLIDGGMLPDGRPYLVMEYVDGVTLDRYCDDRRLPTAERLRLFQVVCSAVHFAHQNLVVHRDLKPANILVTAAGTPKLLDFGIAKVIAGPDTGAVTVTEERRLTPEYASPEQILGNPVTVATDVYSLGIVLFELLTGQKPYQFESRTPAAMESIICNEHPQPPSAVFGAGTTRRNRAVKASAVEANSLARGATPHRLRHELRGDLDTIVLKALRKEPSQRYASVEQFAADIERQLAGLPVLARPDSVGYRMCKFVGRHVVGTVAAASVAFAIVAAMVAIQWGAGVARRERDAAYLARDQAEATADFFEEMLSAADPANTGPEAKVRTVLDSAAVRVIADLRERPLLQASIRSTIGRTYLGLGLLEEAEEHIRAAVEMRKAVLDPGHHDLAESEFDLARLLHTQARYDEAEQLLRSSLATHRRLRGEENVDTARVWNDLGAVLRAGGKIAEAESALRTALAIREKLVGRRSLDTAETLNNLAGVLRAKGDAAGAESLMTEVLETRRAVLRDEHPLVIQSLANLAVMVVANGDYGRGEGLLRQAVALERTVFGPKHHALATGLASLGRILVAQGRANEAEPLMRESVSIREDCLSPEDERLHRSRADLGRCLIALGRDAEAEPLLRGAVAAIEERLRPGDAFWIAVVEDLEAIYRRANRPEKVEFLRPIRAVLAQQ